MLDTDIAIIGLAGRFPGANNVDFFWSNINNKINSISQFDDNELIKAGIALELLRNPKYVKAKGYLEDADYFDAEFFKFSKHDAEILDPQYRLLFEVTWEALENAAYDPGSYLGKMGIFVGSSNINTYYVNNLLQNTKSTLLTDNFTVALHNAKDFLSALIAYKLNLRGPAVTVQTACSTSLVAVCMACQSLLNDESDIALAGGTCISMPLKSGYLFQEGMMLSPTGTCSTFDKKADGTVIGDGLGIVVLKRLSIALKDGDYIHAVIKGFSVNNDGSSKIGFTAPSVVGQQAVIQNALNMARVKPEMISYIEAHGTGTILGDLIEVEALTKIFKGPPNSIVLGSVKPNIGHLDAASGIANLIKATQALKYHILPPNINFDTPSPQINFPQTPFRINTENASWESVTAERYAGVNSSGMGGTNAHVILTEAPRHKKKNNILSPVLLVLSARSHSALNAMKKNLATFLDKNHDINLSDVGYTLQVGRKHFNYRAAYICNTLHDAIHQLQQQDVKPAETLRNANSKELADLALHWLAGGEVNWPILCDKTNYHRVPLPTYVFERKRYWITRDALILPAFKSASSGLTSGESALKSQDVMAIEHTVKNIFEKFFIQKDIDITWSFNKLGGDSLTALLITHEISKTLSLKLPFSIFDNNLSIKSLSAYIVNNIENQ